MGLKLPLMTMAPRKYSSLTGIRTLMSRRVTTYGVKVQTRRYSMTGHLTYHLAAMNISRQVSVATIRL